MIAHFDTLNTAGLHLEEVRRAALRAEESRDFSPEVVTPAGRFTVGLSTGTSGTRGVFVVGRAERLAWAGVMLRRLLPRLAAGAAAPRAGGLRAARRGRTVPQRAGAAPELPFSGPAAPGARAGARVDRTGPDAARGAAQRAAGAPGGRRPRPSRARGECGRGARPGRPPRPERRLRAGHRGLSGDRGAAGPALRARVAASQRSPRPLRFRGPGERPGAPGGHRPAPPGPAADPPPTRRRARAGHALPLRAGGAARGPHRRAAGRRAAAAGACGGAGHRVARLSARGAGPCARAARVPRRTDRPAHPGPGPGPRRAGGPRRRRRRAAPRAGPQRSRRARTGLQAPAAPRCRNQAPPGGADVAG
ncbi:Coenzyme F390 synthetase FtsA [Deinococcus gobiensis I-0]|uniref:Coenzyme F390 synthetase FtsA n=1 Tax=Deinococcus gobiensis (strain DSM 21396 / JCM 16679 / CGMCC 1.7299 / I-0) TaxID=745776 RepID=H8GXK1_DEIGI|nr:Coenzyme F390 synthetase FtsA [Deinococcus gobiensis I-0]